MFTSKARRKVDQMKYFLQALIAFQLIISLVTPARAQLHNANSNGNAIINRRQRAQDNVVAEMQVLCHSDAIVLKVNTNTPFNGMLYAKDSPNGNNCASEFHSATNMSLRLPLRSCGTLSAELDDGIEYFNTVVVQPHMRLMTNQGKGYHIRCKYQTRERTIANTHFNVSAAFLMQNGPQASSVPLLATASMPSCTMKIFRSGRDNVAETVKIGDKLIMVIEIDQQDMYGMKITNCVVRDGMNLAEQQLINEQGCPLDETIMPKFDYTNNFTKATVSFPAHKFPHTSSVYYQCNVRLCINNGNCDHIDCSQSSGSGTPATGGGGSASSATATATATASTSATTITSNNLASSASTNNAVLAVVAPNGGPRRKRFVGHLHSQQQQQASLSTYNNNNNNNNKLQDFDSLQTQRSELMLSMLPAPSELRHRNSNLTASSSTNNSNEDQREQQMSFDVYSGLYVSDADESEQPSTNNQPQPQPQQQQQQQRQKHDIKSRSDLTPSSSLTSTSSLVPQSSIDLSSPSDRTANARSGQQTSCFSWARAGLVLAVASCVSVCMVAMLACQVGLIGGANTTTTTTTTATVRPSNAAELGAQHRRHLAAFRLTTASSNGTAAPPYHLSASTSALASLSAANQLREDMQQTTPTTNGFGKFNLQQGARRMPVGSKHLYGLSG